MASTDERNATRVAVVTGGASGLGAAICRHLADAGRKVAVLDLNAEAAEELAGALRAAGAHATAASVDVSDRTAVDDALAQVRAELGPIEILVTSAAIAGFVPFEALTIDVWTQTLAVNLTGTFHCIQAAIADMVAARLGAHRHDLVVGGAEGFGPTGALLGVEGRRDRARRRPSRSSTRRGGSRSTPFRPFSVDTPMLRAAEDAKLLPPREVVERMIPAGRLGTADDIAAACTFLCSDEAGYITGQVIAPNGGAVL